MEVFGKDLGSVWNTVRRDLPVPVSSPTQLQMKKHIEYLLFYAHESCLTDNVATEYLRMSSLFWLIGSMDIITEMEWPRVEFIVDFVARNLNEDGGYAAADGHDSILFQTLSAIQILKVLNATDVMSTEMTVNYIRSLQNEDGSFSGDVHGEVDTRFSFCALASLHLLDRLDAVDVGRAVDFVLKCYNFDGGFGTRPGSESHAGQVYCCLGALSIAGALNMIDADRTGEWLAGRQCPSGGLCGRPEKLPDVCYSWWVLASLAMIGRLHWIDKESITRFILASQDEDDGGIADRPGDMSDLFHTIFGLSGLSLLHYEGLEAVDPALLSMTKRCLGRYAVKLG